MSSMCDSGTRGCVMAGVGTADVQAASGTSYRAAVASGVSSGIYMVLEMRDGDKSKLRDKGILKSVVNIIDIIATQGLMFVQRRIAQASSSAPRGHVICWMRMADGFVSSRLMCKDDLNSHEAVWSTLRRGPRTTLIARHWQNLRENSSVVSLVIELCHRSWRISWSSFSLCLNDTSGTLSARTHGLRHARWWIFSSGLKDMALNLVTDGVDVVLFG